MDDDSERGPRTFRITPEDQHIREAQMGLDELLKRGKAIMSREARERAAKATQDQLDAVQARHLRASQLMAERFEWKPVAAVGIFEVQTCTHCHTQHQLFRGFGTRMMRKLDRTVRIAKAECLDRGLPYERHEIIGSAPVCSNCEAEVTAPMAPPEYELHLDRKEDATP